MSNPASSSNWIIEGFLEKGKHFRNMRYFYMSDRGKLCYCDAPTQPVKQTLYITDNTLITYEDSKRICRLSNVLPSDISKQYFLAAPTAGEYARWKNAFRRVLSSTASATAQREYDRAVLHFLDRIRDAFNMALAVLVTDDSFASPDRQRTTNMDSNDSSSASALLRMGSARVGPSEKSLWVDRLTKFPGVSSTPEIALSRLAANGAAHPVGNKQQLYSGAVISFADAMLLQSQLIAEQGQAMPRVVIRILSLALRSAKGGPRADEEEEEGNAVAESLFDTSLPTGSRVISACAAFQAERERLAESRLSSMWRKAMLTCGAAADGMMMPPIDVHTVVRHLISPQWIVPNLIVDVLHDALIAFLSQQDTRFSTEPGAGMCGLQNLGNTCFLNAALQCLLHTPQVKRFLLMSKLDPRASAASGGGEGAGSTRARGTAEPMLTKQLVALATKVWTKPHASVDPSAIRAEFDRVTFGRFTEEEEHDAHEALLALLDGLHDELNASSAQSLPYRALPDHLGRHCSGSGESREVLSEDQLAKIWWDHHLERNKSIVQSLFHGQIRQSITCLHCSSVSYCCDPFQFLMLSFPTVAGSEEQDRSSGGTHKEKSSGAGDREEDDAAVDLESLIAKYFAQEILQDSVRCGKCEKIRQCRKQLVMTRAPTYLIMCLKRFRSNKYGQLVAKNDKPVSIPHELDMSPFTTPSCNAAVPSSSSAEASHGSGRHSRTHSSLSSSDSEASSCGGGPSDPFALPFGLQSYQLYAIVHHAGSLSSGHYYATCLCRGKWFLFNDSSILPLQPGWEDDAASTSYILLYRLRRV